MSRTYDVIRSGVAENDLKEVIEYIATDSPTNALKTLRQEASNRYAFLNAAAWYLNLKIKASCYIVN